MKEERTAAALIIALVRARVRRMLGAKDYNDAMGRVVALDMLLNELDEAESRKRVPE